MVRTVSVKLVYVGRERAMQRSDGRLALVLSEGLALFVE